jgi:hypothetical protein
MLRASDRFRLITMLGTLCILGMIIFLPQALAPKKPPADDEVERGESSKAAKSAEKSVEKEAALAGPTDEDSEEWAEAQNEFQVLTDGTVEIGELEMVSYRRLFDWVENQSFSQMKKRAAKNITLDDLMRSPGKFRGKLMQIDLNLRQAIPQDGGPLGVKTVYELRGFSEDSGAWLYFVIVPSLPEGMPTGANINEQVRVEGYFFQLHGYLEAGAKPRAALLKAPLLIGRVKGFVTPGEKAAPANYDWLYWVAAGFLLVSMIFTVANYFARRRALRHQAQLDEIKIQRSLASMDQGSASGGDASDLPEDSRDIEEGFDFRKSP